MTAIGRFRNGVVDHMMGAEYAALAEADEAAARLLHTHGLHRHSMYAATQALEKYVKAKIFSIVSARHACFRNDAATHRLDDLLVFLIKALAPTDLARMHVTQQLKRVFGGIPFGHLSNDLRYPRYAERNATHSILEVCEADSRLLLQMLESLKTFLTQADYLTAAS